MRFKRQSKTIRFHQLVTFLMLLGLAGCTGAPGPTATPGPQGGDTAPSVSPVVADAPPTEEPAEMPTATPAPMETQPTAPAAEVGDTGVNEAEVNVQSGEEAVRIAFGPGESSAEIHGMIAERGMDQYVVRAEQGQIMSVEIISPNGDVLLTVVGEDGIPLKRYQNGPPSWTSQLPASQDYYLHAVSVGPATEYTLRVQIEPLAESSGERIEFAPGETTIQRSGALPAGGFIDYVLSGSAGQGLHVQTVGYGAPVSFVVRSPGGATWSGEPLPAGAYIYALQVVLPDDGEYVITLSVPATAGAAQYDVVFTAVDASAIQTTPVPNEPAERVEFEPGGISAERSGLMPSGWGIKQYVLAASVGQTFAMDVRSDGTPLNVTVEGPSGNRWLPEMTPTEDTQVIHYQMVLPETGDYVISLNKPDHTPSTNYTVSFTIQ